MIVKPERAQVQSRSPQPACGRSTPNFELNQPFVHCRHQEEPAQDFDFGLTKKLQVQLIEPKQI
jgi:hypothetical protein